MFEFGDVTHILIVIMDCTYRTMHDRLRYVSRDMYPMIHGGV
jgi:hypothetical protein